MKKLLSILLTVVLFIGIIPMNQASASTLTKDREQIMNKDYEVALKEGTVRKYTIKESDYIKMLKSKSSKELSAMGISKEQLNSANSDLLNLAKMSTEELRRRNYSNKEIAAIKKYDGKQDAYVHMAAYGIPEGELSVTYFPSSTPDLCTKNRFTFNVWATWTRFPICQYVDILAVTWYPAKSNSDYIQTKMLFNSNLYDTWAYAVYERNSDGNRKTVDLSVNTASSSNGASVRIPLTNGKVGSQHQYPEYGMKTTKFRVAYATLADSYNIVANKILVKYGHSELNTNPIAYIGTSTNFNITFNMAVAEEFAKTIVYAYDGSLVTEY